MKRSEINRLIAVATETFQSNGWTLPPEPKWDVTDFGLGDWKEYGLVLVNLAEEPEYCEKLMFALQGMKTPFHTHIVKKEDIVCRWGVLQIAVLGGANGNDPVEVKRNGVSETLSSGTQIVLEAGHRLTLFPGVYHEFVPVSDRCIIGEVSTANDDAHDNVFMDARVGRFSVVEEDEPPVARLVSDAPKL